MDIRELLQGPVSKNKAERIRDLVLEDKALLDELVEVFLSSNYRMCQSAAMAIAKIGDHSPDLIGSYIPSFVNRLQHKPGDAVTRNILRLLQNEDIPESHQGLLVDYCFRCIQCAKTPVAIKVFAMTVLSNMCRQYPEMAHELILIIEELMLTGTAGVRSRGRKILVQLEKL